MRTARALVAITGLLSFCYGLYCLYPPILFIFLGGLLAAGAWIAEAVEGANDEHSHTGR